MSNKKSTDKMLEKLQISEVGENPKKTIDQLRNKLNKKTGNEGKVVVASEKESIPRIPTGILDLDVALNGGMPRGRIVLLAGGESSYKSTICLKTIAEAQKRGGVAVYVDAERSFNRDWAQANGVDLEKLLILEPSSAEEAYDLMTECILSGVDLMVLDSLNTLVVKKEMFADEKGLEAASIEKNALGLAQKMASQWFRTSMGRIDKAKTTMLIITQLRDNLNAGMYGNPNSIPGGRAVRFNSSVILMTRLIGGAAGRVMIGEKQVAQKYEVKIEKSRFNKPGTVAEFTMYGSMPDNYSAMLKIGLELNFIEKIGLKKYVCNGRDFNGKNAIIQELHDNKELYDWCMDKINTANKTTIFSYNPYSKEDVEAKEAAKEAARNHSEVENMDESYGEEAEEE